MPYPIRNLVIKSTIEFSYFSDMSSHNSNNRSEKYFKLSSALNSYLCIKVDVRGQSIKVDVRGQKKISTASSKMFVFFYFFYFFSKFRARFVCLFQISGTEMR